MNDILFGNNNTEVIKRLSKRYFKKNRVRNLAAILAIMLTAFLFTSITSLVFSMSSSIQLSMQMQKGSKADGDIRYLTEEQYQELQDSDFIKEAGCRRFVGFASNASGHMIEINYADPVQQELTFCTPTHGKAPKEANEIATTDQALEALGVKAKVGERVLVEFTLRGKSYQYEMVVSGWWEAANDTGSLMIVSEQFLKDNPDLFINTYAKDREIAGTYMADVVLKDKRHIQKQLQEFALSVGGEPEQMNGDNYIACSQNQVGNAMLQPGMMMSAIVFVLLFVVSGYLLIYNIFDISVMQDVRQYGLLRTIGTSTRQIKKIVNRQAIWLTLIGLPLGLIFGFLVSKMLLPVVMKFFQANSLKAMKVSVSPLIFLIAAVFTIFTVIISTRKPAKKAAKISPLEAIRYTGQENKKTKKTKRTHGAKLSYMAFSNLGRNKRRSVFIVLSMLLCIVLFNSIIVITQSMDEEKWISRSTKTDFTVYNSVAVNGVSPFQYREDGLPDSVVNLINQQKGVEKERILYRNTRDDSDVTVDYKFEDLVCIAEETEEDYVSKAYENGSSLRIVPGTEDGYFGNVFGVSEAFWEDVTIYEGENNPDILKKKMETGDYVIVGTIIDRLTGEAENETQLQQQLQVGDSITFSKDGKEEKTCTILAKATVVATEYETYAGANGATYIGGDAPFLYMSDTKFKELYEEPTIFSYSFNAEQGKKENLEGFLADFTGENTSVAYTSTKLLQEQLASNRNIVLLVGGMIGVILAFAGLINFTNMMVTNIITRRHEFAAMQSIGMTNRQLRRLIMDEGLYFAVGADVIGGLLAVILGMTVLKNVLNSPSMWYFTLRFTLVPALFIAVIYLILAAVIPVVVLHFFNKGSVVERLRTVQ
ncbi:ABC transporter permease [[Ruminococcus] torques]|uniref:ABC transporter permease n=1 Tax=[Ruminococcus] torques TaxID=33039 RepID=UPI00265EC827|nr:FtsX-like permease family protein [[Ruminococcus] torques]